MIKPIVSILILSNSWLLEINMPSPAAPRPHPQSRNLQVGEWGEQLVCQWLTQQQWHILDRRWHCRWGELDIIARSSASPSSSQSNTRLAFVEVKTRRAQNWDADGLLAITQQKQQKLWKTAQLYLKKNPELAELFCQFDVALVQCNLISESLTQAVNVHDELQVTTVEINQPIRVKGYQFILLDYIESAFTL